MEQGVRGEDARRLSEHLLELYFKTQDYPYTRHHIESFDQFLSQDLPAIVQAQNPILLLHGVIPNTKSYEYKAEISPEALWRVIERADYKESDLQHLRRSKPSPGYCLGQGEGYYDYITGNFS